MKRVIRRKCKVCRKSTRFVKDTYGIAVHILLAVFTLGLYLLCLPFMLIFGNKYRCERCGSR